MTTLTHHRTTTLKRLRHERGLTLREVGEMTDTNYMTMARWENGVSEPFYRNARKLERIFGLPIEELLATENE
jgi:transcriptional regulator with XRE-family HTH domain